MSNLTEREVFAKTLWGEARGEGYNGWVAVAHVIMNRAKDRTFSQWNGWPNDVQGVCLQPNHFECWDSKTSTGGQLTDINVSSDMDSYKEILKLVDSLPMTTDPTGGADHYHNPDSHGEWEKSKRWRENCKKTVKIGNHQFYKQYK